MKITRPVSWFGLLAGAHLLLFWALPYALPSFTDALRLFSVNVLPWLPLRWLGLPVTNDGWLMTPNAVGWLWCFAVWSGLYLCLARRLARLGRRSRGAGRPARST